MPTITMVDGTDIYYKDWGTGQPVVFSHGWPLRADAWEDQMLFLAGNGYRCIAHDRRGHGRSSQPWNGNDMNTYADDLATLVPTLIIHGDDDQIVPIGASALLSSKIVKGSILKVYPGGPHGLPSTLKDQVNAELLAFLREQSVTPSRQAVPA
jgi:pimeloyl-ACP methyl ester carboxylesterase